MSRSVTRYVAVAVLAGAMLLGSSAPAQAFPPPTELMIDSFDTTQSLLADSTNQDVTSSVSTAGSDIIGGTRDAAALYDSGPSTISLVANEGGSSVLNYNGSAGTSGSAWCIWDGDSDPDVFSPTGLGSEDLTLAGVLDRIAIMVDFDDLPVDLIFKVYTDASNWSQATLRLPGGIHDQGDPPTQFNVPFSSFVTQAGTGADFTNVGAISLDISELIQGTNLQVDFIKAVVPEPVSIILLALGILALVPPRWR